MSPTANLAFGIPVLLGRIQISPAFFVPQSFSFKMEIILFILF